MTTVKVIPVIKPSAPQRKWLDAECKRTNESQATVIRMLIQEKINNG